MRAIGAAEDPVGAGAVSFDGSRKQVGIIWRQPLRNPKDWPRLQSILVAGGGEKEAIFEGGPDGRYLFDRDNGLLVKHVVGARSQD